MANKVIMVVVDGLAYQTAVDQCGFLESLVEGGKARRWKMRCTLPTLSAPIYETLHTGTVPHEHGITSNDNLRLSTSNHVFGEVRKAGKTTGAVANAYFSVLYNQEPYVHRRDMEVNDESLTIQHGRFYDDKNHSSYNIGLPSDIDLFNMVNLVTDRYSPDYLLYHNCSCDSIGHVFGCDSPQYKKSAWMIDDQFAQNLQEWVADGYRVFITADHGFTNFGHHGGTTDDVRYVAFYDVGHPNPGVADEVADQLAVAPTILDRMGVAIPDSMKVKPLD